VGVCARLPTHRADGKGLHLLAMAAQMKMDAAYAMADGDVTLFRFNV
jgi:hypothetical protein